PLNAAARTLTADRTMETRDDITIQARTTSAHSSVSAEGPHGPRKADKMRPNGAASSRLPRWASEPNRRAETDRSPEIHRQYPARAAARVSRWEPLPIEG